MPDQYKVPAPKRFDPDDLDLPVAVAAMDAIDGYVGARSGAGHLNVALAKARIAALHTYLRIVDQELDVEVSSQMPLALGVPS